MLLQDRLDEALVEIAVPAEAVGGEGLKNEALQFVPHPDAEGDVEADFFLVQDRLREAPGQGFLEDVLGPEAPELEGAGNRGGELDERIIQERRPDLERGGHAHPVDFREKVVLEVKLQIEVSDPVERIGRPGVRGVEGDRGVGVLG